MIERIKNFNEIGIKNRPVLDDITILIPTLGRSILESCLHSIVTSNCWPKKIIVVDQGANPEVASWLDKMQSTGMQALHVKSLQRGRAAALNLGLKKLETRFVAITDDDCFVEKSWIENMSKRLAENPDSIITGRVDPTGDEKVMSIVTRQHSVIHRRPGLKFDPMSGGNMGTSGKVLERVGFFDEDPRLGCAEDGEWAYRALRSGVTIIYFPEILVRHYGWRNKNQRVDQYKSYARSHGAFLGKYIRQGDWFILLRATIHFFRALKRWIYNGIIGNKELAIIGRSYALGLIPGIIAGFRKANINE